MRGVRYLECQLMGGTTVYIILLKNLKIFLMGSVYKLRLLKEGLKQSKIPKSVLEITGPPVSIIPSFNNKNSNIVKK